MTRYDNNSKGCSCDHTHGCRRGRGRGYGHGCGRRNYNFHFKNTSGYHKRTEKGEKEKGEITKNACHHCGGRTHWACNCCTPTYLVDLDQEPIEKKKIETNFASNSNNGIFDGENFDAQIMKDMTAMMPFIWMFLASL